MMSWGSSRSTCALPLDVILSVGLAMVSALEHVHAAGDPRGIELGLVHRDVSRQAPPRGSAFGSMLSACVALCDK